MKTKTDTHALLLCFFVIFSIIGCNNNPQLGGKVTFDDGLPLTAGMVVLDNGTVTSRAPIQSDGTFVVGTATEKDGVAAGTYKVYVTGAVEMLDNPKGLFPPPSRQLIHEKYSKPETSGLTVTVSPKNEPLNITVTKP